MAPLYVATLTVQRELHYYSDFSPLSFKMDDDNVDWQVLKPEVFATVMDFFSSGLPVVTEEHTSIETGAFFKI